MTVIIESSKIDSDGKIIINFNDGNVITFRSESEMSGYIYGGAREDEEVINALKHILVSSEKNISSPIKIEIGKASVTDIATGNVIIDTIDNVAVINGK